MSGAAGRVMSVRAPKQRIMKRSARSCAVRVVMDGFRFGCWGGWEGLRVVLDEVVDDEEVVEYEPGDAAFIAAAAAADAVAP